MADPESVPIPNHDSTARAATGSRTERILLVRRAADVDAGFFDIRAPASTWIFLHGDAVSIADRLSASMRIAGGLDAAVCSTSWRRRYPERAPPPPFAVSTLTQLIARLARGVARIDSYGAGGICCSRDSGSGSYLLEVAFAPASRRQAAEVIEWLLAAASMELDLRVLFSGGGIAHLDGDGARAWRQFTDFGLVELYVHSRDGRAPPGVDVGRVGTAGAVRLRGAARQVILL